LTWADVNGRGFAASLIVVVTDCSDPFVDCLVSGFGDLEGPGSLNASLVVTNLTSGTVDIEMFGYADLDLAGSSLGDTAELLPTRFGPRHTVREGGTTSVTFAVDDLTAPFRATLFGVLRDALNDADVDDLDGSGFPLGPADVTIAVQVSRTLGPAGSSGDDAALNMALELDWPFFLDGFESGNTSVWSSSFP
jgi:hypothetical protein